MFLQHFKSLFPQPKIECLENDPKLYANVPHLNLPKCLKRIETETEHLKRL